MTDQLETTLTSREIAWAADATRFRLRLAPGKVDVFGAIRSEGIALLLFPFGREAIEGAYRRHETQAFIVVNSLRSRSHQRFTAAHELGHHVLHGDRVSEIVDDYLPTTGKEPASPLELEAEHFGAYFLMDTASVLAEADGSEDPFDLVARMTTTFGVSKPAVCRRLAELGILDAKTATRVEKSKVPLGKRLRDLDLDDSATKTDGARDPGTNYLARMDLLNSLGLIPDEQMKSLARFLPSRRPPVL
jgi:Zn-dependent peptidase ImmA (M78 family)